MKKYITVAALLAAGTAFANADVVAVFNCGGYNNGRNAWMDTTQGWTPATLGTTGGSFNADADGITLSSTTVTGVFSSTGPGGSFTVGTSGGTGPYAIPEALKTLSSDVLGDGYGTLWGGSTNLYGTGQVTFTLGGLKANTEYTVYLFSARANNGSNNGGGSVTWTTETSGASWSVTTADGTSSGSTVQADGSTTGDNASIVKVTFNTGDATEFAFDSGSNAAFTLNGIVVETSSIPEPSAFGLLAGLGALALVASRRRRK